MKKKAAKRVALPPSRPGRWAHPRSFFIRLAIVLAGIFLGQAILFGPSLIGHKVLLPLDLLAQPGFYIPNTSAQGVAAPHNLVLMDLIDVEEPSRRFVGAELHAGRFPLWNPSQYGGAPLTFSKFSPFILLLAWFQSPLAIAWMQVLIAMIAGTGIYAFCRRVLRVAFWPAALVAWCYPITAFFVLWQGYRVVLPVIWLPWLLLAVHAAIRRPRGIGVVAVALVTGLTVLSGQFDIAGQVLLTSGFFALWCLARRHRKKWFSRPAFAALLAVTFGWGLGLLLSAPDIIPTLEYVKTGARIVKRGAGLEERPPVGMPALPQVLFPNIYGSTEKGSLAIFPEGQPNLLESSAGASAGVLAILFLAPLAWRSRRHRSINGFLLLLVIFTLGWSLDLPGLVSLLRLPGLSLMSHNRFVFATAFALLAMAAIGLDVLWRRRAEWRWWFWGPVALLFALGAWNLARAMSLPDRIAGNLMEAIERGRPILGVSTAAGVDEIQAWFLHAYIGNALLCGLGILAWLVLRFGGPRRTRRLIAGVAVVMTGELLWFGFGRSAQCDPALYYPRIPMFEEIARSVPGRVVGYQCLPARLAEMANLSDIRGYDAVDPSRLMDLLGVAADPNFQGLSYAMTQWFYPRLEVLPDSSARLSPVLDMLGVRYVIFRGVPPDRIRPSFVGNDYWALTNAAALPRAFIPRRVETVTDDAGRLDKLSSPQFNPRDVAYLESFVDLPASCIGRAEITSEIPTRVTVATQMETAGLLVLADLWDAGWRAYVNGQPAPILRTNHAVRGVVVPAGPSTVQFRYEPASLRWGFGLAAASILLLAGWTISVIRNRRSRRMTGCPQAGRSTT